MAIEQMADLLRGRRAVVLTGAGCSTESGIPDYRGPLAAQRMRAPVQYQEFVRSAQARARYWSRSMIGWSRIADAAPNAGHHALARLEQAGSACGIITQNVDGLHHAAGSRRVVELHGSLAFVRCLECNSKIMRAEFQHQLSVLNPGFNVTAAKAAPDGDADIDALNLCDFQVPDCVCGGLLKPDVVFFGENVPAETVAQAWQVFDEGDCLMVVGSSLTVYSGRRFIYRAQQQQKPIGIINLGSTRADEMAAVKIEARIGEALPELAALLA